MITFQDLVKSLPGDPNQKGLEFEKILQMVSLSQKLSHTEKRSKFILFLILLADLLQIEIF